MGKYRPRDWKPRDPNRGCLIILILIVATGAIVGSAVRLV